MTRMMVGAVVLGLALAAYPAVAKKAAHKGATCQQVKDALAAGKSEADAAKELNVSEARIKSCTTTASKPAKKTHKAS